jgi:hypothetical protein
MRSSLTAARASGESLVAPSNFGCAPSRCRNPPLVSIGWDVSGGALWANVLAQSKQMSAIAPKKAATRGLNRSVLKDTYPSLRKRQSVIFLPLHQFVEQNCCKYLI